MTGRSDGAPPRRDARSASGSRGSGFVGRSESVAREDGGGDDGNGGGWGGCDGDFAAAGWDGGGSEGRFSSGDPSMGDPSMEPDASSAGLAGTETDRERTSSDINDSKAPHRNESIPDRATESLPA